jgi:hypothetical protein
MLSKKQKMKIFFDKLLYTEKFKELIKIGIRDINVFEVQ